MRLLLTLGEKLLALDRQQEAYEDYQKLLQEFPDYPDKLAIYRKLLPLAQKLGKKADAEQYEAEINRLSPPPPPTAPPKPSGPGGQHGSQPQLLGIDQRSVTPTQARFQRPAPAIRIYKAAVLSLNRRNV